MVDITHVVGYWTQQSGQSTIQPISRDDSPNDNILRVHVYTCMVFLKSYPSPPLWRQYWWNYMDKNTCTKTLWYPLVQLGLWCCNPICIGHHRALAIGAIHPDVPYWIVDTQFVAPCLRIWFDYIANIDTGSFITTEDAMYRWFSTKLKPNLINAIFRLSMFDYRGNWYLLCYLHSIMCILVGFHGGSFYRWTNQSI